VRAPTDGGLGLRLVIERAASESPNNRVVTRTADGVSEFTYRELGHRVRALADALETLGVRSGDRVASLACNSHRHLEVLLGVACVGAVTEVVNIRFPREAIERLLFAASPRVLFVDATLLDALPRVPEGVPVVVLFDGGEERQGFLSYEELLARGDRSFVLPELDELLPAVACFTSATTGEPKAVEYSHRSLVLGSLIVNQPGVTPLLESDRVLPIVPFFHASAWGLPFAAMLSGAELVLGGAHPSAADLARLIETERVTKAAGVPTVLADVLDVAGADLSSLEEVYCAGMQPSVGLVRGYRERFGAQVVHAWGMTETCFFGLVSRPPAGVELGDVELGELAAAQGRSVPLLEQRIVEGGELQIRGPAVAGKCVSADGPDRYTADGWLRTGDVAISLRGRFVRIVDRLEDTIKSGGEWIHSLVLEARMRDFDAIADVAVVAARDDRWSERPYAFVVLADGASLDVRALYAFLAARMPGWWIPDVVEPVEALPRIGNGKVDKRALRARLEAGRSAGSIPLHAPKAEAVAP
jgi:fatty-acyl-CoA synthase